MKRMPKQRVKTTVGIFVEGESAERLFSYFARGINKKRNVYIKTYDCGGGSPDSIANRALNKNYDPDKKFFYYDKDGGKKNLSKEKTEQLLKNGFQILEAEYCLEEELFRLLDPTWKRRGKTSAQIKDVFLKKHGEGKKITSIDEKICEKCIKIERLKNYHGASNCVVEIIRFCLGLEDEETKAKQK